jgi:hypothetical protein
MVSACRGCSLLYSWFSRLRGRSTPDCRELNISTDGQPDRVPRINAVAPNCACEAHPMSRYSPGRVKNQEEIARFLFHPEQIGKKGKLKSNVFSRVISHGMSVQRETRATDDELADFVRGYLSRKSERKWHGVLVAGAARLREIKLQGIDGRAVCLYDTAERTNPSHAEICSGQTIEDNGDANELRRLLHLEFDADHPIDPDEYRGGVLSRLAAD